MKKGYVGVVQSGQEKAPVRPYCGLPLYKGCLYGKLKEPLLPRPTNRKTGNSFKLKEVRFRLNIRKKF